MQELSDPWRFGSFAVAGPARPLNSLGYSSGPLIRNHNANELMVACCTSGVSLRPAGSKAN